MQIKLVIASILKPVDDTRMYEKIGISLSNTNKYEVNIIGFYSKKIIKTENIKFYPVFKFSRLSIYRLVAPLKYLRILFKVKPKLIIVTTPELLHVTYFYKLLKSCKIIYDIQENYLANLRYNKVYPPYINLLLSYLVRKIEVLFSKHVCFFFLAETCYEKELDFLGKKYIVLENKYKELYQLPAIPKIKENIHLLYSGTIAINYGILEAIQFSKVLQKNFKNIKFTIAGYCAQKDLFEKVKSEIAGFEFIELIGGNTLVPHSEIIKLIKISDFGLVPYQPDKSIDCKIPTKLYEYLVNRLPVIIQNHALWISFCDRFNAAIPIDYNSFDVYHTMELIQSKTFFNSRDQRELLWETEENKLLDAIEKCIST